MGNSSTTIILPVETENDEAAFWKLYDEIYCETSAPSSEWGLPGVAAKHPPGFTKPKDRVIRSMISWLISQWSWTRSPGHGGTLIRPRDTAQVRQVVSDRRDDLLSARIDYQGADSDGIHHRYAIQLGSDQHFATIHINRNFNFSSPRILRRAFWLSVLTGQHIYVEDDNSCPATIDGSKEGFRKAYDDFFSKQKKRAPRDEL